MKEEGPPNTWVKAFLLVCFLPGIRPGSRGQWHASDWRFGLWTPWGVHVLTCFLRDAGASNTLNSNRRVRGGISGHVSGWQEYPSGEDHLCELGVDYTETPCCELFNNRTWHSGGPETGRRYHSRTHLAPALLLAHLCVPWASPGSSEPGPLDPHSPEFFEVSDALWSPAPASAGDCRLKHNARRESCELSRLGQNEESSPGDGTSGSCEDLLQSGRGEPVQTGF